VAGVCRGNDVVITVLPSPAVSRKVVEGPGGVFENLRSGGIWIEMSTTDFEDLQRLSDAAAARGISVLECPVTGGVHLANSGQITVLVGGEEGTFKQVENLLTTMGGEIIYMGKLGNASVVKVVTNMLAFIHLIAAGEAMMVPAKYGVDPDATYRAIRASSGNSFVHETESKLILSGSYNVKGLGAGEQHCRATGCAVGVGKPGPTNLPTGARAAGGRCPVAGGGTYAGEGLRA
jgi:3-hydroxyisobutyrate dehydrogenase